MASLWLLRPVKKASDGFSVATSSCKEGKLWLLSGYFVLERRQEMASQWLLRPLKKASDGFSVATSSCKEG
ncbi:hypothetical protein BgiBS90_024470, partial [Biomphalaria glabrata]